MNRRTGITSILLVSALGLALVPGAAEAYIGLCCAKCGGNMPMNIPGGGIPETHEFRIKISPVFMRMDDLKQSGSGIDPGQLLGMPSMGRFMAVETGMDMSMLNLSVGYSFTDRSFGGLMLMYANKRMDMRFNTPMATMTGRSGYTMTSSGPADGMLMFKYRLFADDPLVPRSQGSLFLGLSLPTGSIEEHNQRHPVMSRRAELLPYGMQLGSGTFDPSFGFLYQGSNSPYWWGVNALYTARLYDNDQGYHLGDDFRLDAYGMTQIRSDLLVEYQINGEYRQGIDGAADQALSGRSGHAIAGDPSSPFMTPLWDPNNYGGRKIRATVGLQWQPKPFQIVDLAVTVPLEQQLSGIQLEEAYTVMLTWYVEIPTRRSIRHPDYRPEGGRLGF